LGIVSFNRDGWWHFEQIIRVQARFFHGRHRGKTYWLGVDTGASRTTLGVEIASELGIDLAAEGMKCTIQTMDNEVQAHRVKIGRIMIANETLAKFEVWFTKIPSWVQDQGADGLLGRDFLSQFHLHIDFEHYLLTLERRTYQQST
jgi:clan AA aspartic protease (TIGR02281 family)